MFEILFLSVKCFLKINDRAKVKPNCLITFPFCYRDAPLYLEWAPGNILEPKTLPDNKEQESDDGVNDVRKVNLEQQVEIDPYITEVCPVMIAVDDEILCFI